MVTATDIYDKMTWWQKFRVQAGHMWPDLARQAQIQNERLKYGHALSVIEHMLAYGNVVVNSKTHELVFHYDDGKAEWEERVKLTDDEWAVMKTVIHGGEIDG